MHVCCENLVFLKPILECFDFNQDSNPTFFLQKDGEKNVLRIVTHDSFQKTLGLNPTLQKKNMVTKTMEKVKTGLRLNGKRRLNTILGLF